MHFRACRYQPTGKYRPGVTAIDKPRQVRCQPVVFETMTKFLDMRTKNGGPRRNSEVVVEVDVIGEDIKCADIMEEHVYAPLQVRVLDAQEKLSFDFQESKTISEIVSEVVGKHSGNLTLNDLRLDVVLKSCKTFSGHCHSVIADRAVPIDRVALYKVTVDIDSALAVFKRRKVSAEKKTIAIILKEVSDILEENWIGFQSCTNYCANNDWIKALPTKLKGGPTIEPFPESDRFRVRLPTPPGSEVLKVYIYSPSNLSHERFIASVKGIAHNCASSLLKQYNRDRLDEALQSTHEKKIHGGKPCAVPGGYKFAIGIALLFLEEHPEGTFVLETYNNKQKNLHFKMPANGFGSDAWLNSCTRTIVDKVKTCDTMLKVMCRLDRLAEIDSNLSRIGFGFEMM